MTLEWKPEEIVDVTWESYIEGPRWMIGPSVIETAVIDLNDSAQRIGRQKGLPPLDPLKVVYLRERKSLMRRTLLFKVEGPKILVRLFRDGVAEAIDNANV